jgi:hypothetical protein
MRLTLRTLLAYLDDILEPNDRETIAGKIEESEFAKKLVHRTHDVVSRLKLGAPSVLGIGVARDPNSLAEYLDNTMAPEQIQDFEKACLESDSHLAETTACHHVLTMVMGEPVHVEPATRDRMYRLHDGSAMRAERPAADSSESTQAATATSSAQDEVSAREQREASSAAVKQLNHVGDMQDDGKPSPAKERETDTAGARSKFWPVALTAMIGAVVGAAVILALDSDIRQKIFGGSETADSPEGGAVAQLPDETQDNDAKQDNPKANAADQLPVKPGDVADDPGPNVVPPSPEAAVDDPAPAPIDPTPIPMDTPNDPVDPVPPVGEQPTDPVPPPADPISADPDGDDKSPDGADDSKTPDQVAKSDPPEDPVLTPESPKPETPVAKPTVIGRLLSSDQILLRTRTSLDKLERVGVQGSLSIGDRLVSLPLFRPLISLPSATVELHEGTMIELAGLDESKKSPQVVVHYGRMVTRSLTMPNARMQLQLGDRAGTIIFDDADSSCAFQVRPYRIVGTDPEKDASLYAVDLFVPSGTVKWVTQDREQQIVGPARLILAPHPAEEEPASELPAWIDTLKIGQLDKRAVSSVEQRVRSGRDVQLSFAELADARQVEIRKLAVRGCAHIGHFEPLIRSLNDPEMRPRWMDNCDDLAAAVARDPASAALIRKSFEKYREDDAFELYRMLWGFSSTGLKEGGEARKLVDFLDHDDLDYRVLSFWNLQQITEVGRNYHPEYTKIKRRRSLESWREMFDRGEIAHKRRVAEPTTVRRGG